MIRGAGTAPLNMLDESDAITDLFLRDAGPLAVAPSGGASEPAGGAGVAKRGDEGASRVGPGGEPPSGRAVPVELVVLGHLPVSAAAWAAQYVRGVSDRAGTAVGVLRIAGEEASVEVVCPAGVVTPTVAGSTVADAASGLTASISRWVVRADEVGEPEAISSCDSVTFLSGADQASVVACYRAMKALCATREEGGKPADVGVAIMGAPAERASRAFQRLSQSARAFLGIELVDRGGVARIGTSGGSSRVLARGAAGLSASAWCVRLSARAVAASLSVHVPIAAAREKPVEAAGLLATADDGSATISWGRPSEARPEDGRDGGSDCSARSGCASVSDTRRSLAALIPGLRGLDVRCPSAAGVELAVGPDGGLHLLAEHAEVVGEPVRSVESLLAAAAWSRLNAELLRRVFPDLRIGGDAVVLHLLTERPASVRGLYDTSVRVHALVRVGDSSATAAVN